METRRPGPRTASSGEVALDDVAPLLWLADAEGRFEYVSDSWSSYTGQPGTVLLGMGWQARLHPEDRMRAAREWCAAALGGRPFQCEFRLAAADGRFAWFRAYAEPRSGATDGLRFLGSATLQGRKPADTRRPETPTANARAIDVLEHGEPVFALDSEFRYVLVNRAQEEISKTRREDTLGRRIWDVFPDTARRDLKFWEVYHRVMRTRSPEQFEEYFAPLGLWLDVRVFPTGEGGIAVFFHRINERRRAEQALQESQQQLRVALARVELERAKLLSVIDALPVGLALVDGTGSILAMNEAGVHLHGFRSSADLIVGLDAFQQDFRVSTLAGQPLPPSEWPAALAVRGERVREMAVRLKNARAGTERVVSYTVVPVPHSASGAEPVWVYVMQDITERHRAELALLESEASFRELAEAIPQLVWLAAPDGRIDYLNQRWQEYAGTREAEPGEELWARLIHPEDLGRTLMRWTRSLRSGEPFEAEFRFRRARDLSYRWFLCRAQPVHDAVGNVVRWFGTSTEIHDLKQAQTDLAEAKRRLEEADRHKDEFLAMLSHELRNPLTPIRNGVYLLERVDGGTEQARRARSVIERQTQHMTRLIDDLLDVTRIAHGKVTLRRAQVDVERLVQTVADDLRDLFSKAEVDLRVGRDSAGTSPLVVRGDATRLAQVLGNLLSNAAKFTPRGGHARVEVAATESGDVTIRVSDDGVGMSSDTLQNAFEPFTQADRSLDRSRGGLGLGLALVKGLVHLHGGAVRAESGGPGRGAAFTVSLPADRGPLPFEERQTSSETPPRPRRVLVIEDNVDAAETLREAIELGRHDVAVAYSGPEGLEVARAFRPDVVFCDIGLPGMDGYSVAQEIRRDPRLRSSFLVALTGYALQEDVQRCQKVGFDQHLAKPADPRAIEALLARYDQSEN
jgi:PAS domain S-box-containing protein